MNDLEQQINRMGFDGKLAADLVEIVRISFDAGREEERTRCARIADERALKLRAKAKEQKSSPPKQSYFAQAIEARVIADAIRRS
jgi:hypothetical protein